MSGSFTPNSLLPLVKPNRKPETRQSGRWGQSLGYKAGKCSNRQGTHSVQPHGHLCSSHAVFSPPRP